MLLKGDATKNVDTTKQTHFPGVRAYCLFHYSQQKIKIIQNSVLFLFLNVRHLRIRSKYNHIVPKESFGGSSPFLNYVCVLIKGEAENIQNKILSPGPGRTLDHIFLDTHPLPKLMEILEVRLELCSLQPGFFSPSPYLRKRIRSHIFQGSFKRWSPRPLPPPHCSTSPKSLNFIEHHNACALYFVSTSPTPLTKIL